MGVGGGVVALGLVHHVLWTRPARDRLAETTNASYEDSRSEFLDRRRITVRLTDRGQALLSRVTTIVTDWERATAHRLGASTVAALRDGVVAGVTAMGLRQAQ